MTQNPLLLASTFAETLNTSNIDLFDTFIAPTYVNHNPFVAPGLQGVKEFFAEWLAAFPDTAVTVEDAFVAGDKVVGGYTYRATQQGPFLGIPATGRPITMRSIDIWRVQDGMFVEHWDELDLLEAWQQLGVVSSL
jgi:predicted SnoaL-like aldol condensation-catalyzing enzyme